MKSKKLLENQLEEINLDLYKKEKELYEASEYIKKLENSIKTLQQEKREYITLIKSLEE